MKNNTFDIIAILEEKMKKEEKSKATINKYVRDVRTFLRFMGEDAEVTKERVISYKNYLAEKYEISSANSMIAAVNYYLRMIGRSDCAVKAFKVQKAAFRLQEREMTKEEYYRLLDTAKEKGDIRLYMVMQTICATGIRISELPFISVQALHTRRAVVSLKGKTRTVILPQELCRELKCYVRERKIRNGSVFVTRGVNAMDRSNILHAMKRLCDSAGVEKSKVFPHNLRHLFAVTYYRMEKDVCHLADILGHSNINTTRIYTMISCEEQEEQLSGLGLCVNINKPHNISYAVYIQTA